MDDILDRIKTQVSVLLEKQNKQQHVQKQREEQHSALIREKKILEEKNQLAIAQIERMLVRLKFLEKT